MRREASNWAEERLRNDCLPRWYRSVGLSREKKIQPKAEKAWPRVPHLVRCGLRSASISPHICLSSIDSARSASLSYCVTSSSNIVPSSLCSLGSGSEATSSTRLRSEDFSQISCHNSRKNLPTWVQHHFARNTDATYQIFSPGG